MTVLNHIRAALSLLAVAALLLAALPARANGDPDADALSDAYLLEDLFAIMAEEGRANADVIRDDMLADRSTGAWDREIARMYDPARMHAAFMAEFADELAGQPDVTRAALDFAGTETGARVLRLEIEAREAMLDDGIDAAARDQAQTARADATALVERVSERIAANDLIEANVSMGLNTSLAYFEGFSATAPRPLRLSADALVPEVMAQEPEIRAEAEEWLYAYFLMAYAPLSEDEMRAYIDFSASAEGQALNTAMFNAFQVVYVDISRDLGRAMGEALSGMDL